MNDISIFRGFSIGIRGLHVDTGIFVCCAWPCEHFSILIYIRDLKYFMFLVSTGFFLSKFKFSSAVNHNFSIRVFVGI